MFKQLKHPNVRILAGMKPFIGQTGVIVNKEDKHYRVKLDTPVEIEGVGTVTDDLWLPADLKVIRPKQATAVKAPAEVAPPVPAAAPEAATVVTPTAEPADEVVAQVAADQQARVEALAEVTATVPGPVKATQHADCKARKAKAPTQPKAKKPKVDRGAVIRRK